MAAEDWLSEGEYEERYQDEGFAPTFTKTCNRCGTPNLRWGEHVTGWRLFTEQGVLHECTNRTSTDTFTIQQISRACRRLGMRSDVVHPLIEFLQRSIK